MAYSEQEVMEQLGIESWRNLSKDKMMRFAAMMPEMDTEVALKIIEQFPAFRDFALDTVKEMEKAHKSTLDANSKSQDQFYATLQDIREILRGELANEDLTWEQRRWIIEQIQGHSQLAFQKDRENKKFLDTTFGKFLLYGGAGLAAGIVVLGGKIFLERGERGERGDEQGSIEA